MAVHPPNALTSYVNQLFFRHGLSFLQPATRLTLTLPGHGTLHCTLGRSEITFSVIYLAPQGDPQKPELEVCCLHDGCGDWRPATVVHHPSPHDWGEIWVA